jgi:HK97 family phage major capsid protein
MGMACTPDELARWGLQSNATTGPGLTYRDASGAACRAIQPNERVSNHIGYDAEEIRVGHCLHAALTGRMDNLSDYERRSMLGGIDSQGGYLLNPQMSSTFIDLARNASVCVRAGAQTVPMATSEMVIARATSDPVGQWRAEGVNVTATGLTLDRMVLRARTLACVLPVSIELLEDATNAPAILQNAIQNALGLQLDVAALTGTGAAEQPLGITNTAGINLTANNGVLQWRLPVDGIGKIVTANYPGPVNNLAWIYPPDHAQNMDSWLSGEGQPFIGSPWMQAVRKFYTNSLSGTHVFGDFSQLIFGMRTSGVSIRILDSGAAIDASGATIDAASSLQKLIVAYLRADVGVMRPSWFSVFTGVTLSS